MFVDTHSEVYDTVNYCVDAVNEIELNGPDGM